jgi:ABC-type transporter Mla MlaB component
VEALRQEAQRHAAGLRLDLTGLSYADAAGAALLTWLLAKGAELAASNAYATTLLGRL